MSTTLPSPPHSEAFSGSVGFAARALSQLGTLSVTIVATRTLSLTEFGAYAIASAIMVLCRNILSVGPFEYLLKTPANATIRGSCLAANVVIAILCVIATIALAMMAPLLFGEVIVRDLLLYLVLSLFMVAVTMWFEAQLLREQRVALNYGLIITGELIGAAGAIVALLMDVGVLALVLQTYIRLTVVILCYLFLGGITRRVGPIDLHEMMRVLSWSRSRFAYVAVNFWTLYGADLLLGSFVSPAASGLYRASNRIVVAVSDLFAQPLLKVAQSSISARVAAGLQPRTEWIMLGSAFAAIGWAALAGLAAMAHWLVPSVLGEQWAAAVPIVIILCLARAASMIDGATTALIVCFDQQRHLLVVEMWAALATLVMGVLLAPYGPVPVAWATAGILLGISIAYMAKGARLTGLSGASLASILAPALLPAAGVFLAVSFSDNLAQAWRLPVDMPVFQVVAGAAGGLVGLAVIWRTLTRYVRSTAV